MGQEFHIQRQGAPILLREWIEAVKTVPALRLHSDGSVARNPRTGAEIRVPGRDGDVQMLFSKDGRWLPVFRWGKGAHFKVTRDASVLRAASELATRLKAQIVDDEGNVVTL